MKKLIAWGAALVAPITAVFAGGSRGAAAYFIATQECYAAADGAIKCVPKEQVGGMGFVVVVIIAAVAIYLYQKKKR